MSEISIKNARGNGQGWEIDSEGRGVVRAITEPRDFHVNEQNGKVWSLPWENTTTAGAGDYVFYIKNTGSKNLMITDVRMSSGTATQVAINAVTGTAGGAPTDITPVARNLGSAELPTATIQQDPDITGLTSAGTLFFMDLIAINTLYHVKTTSNIIIPKGKAVAILVETAGATTGMVSLVEAE